MMLIAKFILWVKTLFTRSPEEKRLRALAAQIKAFAGKDTFHVVLDTSGSMEYYVRENKVDIKGLLKFLFGIHPYMLIGLTHELNHIKTILHPTHLDNLKIKWGGGSDATLLKDFANPVIFITDSCPMYSATPSRILTLCIDTKIADVEPAWVKSTAVNIHGMFQERV